MQVSFSSKPPVGTTMSVKALMDSLNNARIQSSYQDDELLNEKSQNIALASIYDHVSANTQLLHEIKTRLDERA